MRAQLENNDIYDPLIRRGFRWAAETFIPVTGFAIDANSCPMLFFNPAGAVNILMPTSTAARIGLTFRICNLSANTITLQTDGGAAFTAAIAIASTQMTDVVCTGSTTQALGWRAMTAAGTQTSP